MALNFSTFSKTLWKYMKEHKGMDTQTGFLSSLLSSPLYPDEPEEGFMGKTETTRKSAASQYLSGERKPSKKIIRFFEEGGSNGSVEFMRNDILDFLTPGHERDLVNELKALVLSDYKIEKYYRQKINEGFAEVDSIADMSKMRNTEKKALATLLSTLLCWSVVKEGNTYRKLLATMPVFLLCPPPAPYFTGRIEELDAIFENFMGGCPVQVLWGMGGMGKTQIAIQYAYRHRIDYSIIHWIDASSRQVLINSYRRFLSKSNTTFPDTDEGIVLAYLRYMDENSNWLIIYDDCNLNTEQYNEFLGLIPRELDMGNILITSRRLLPIGGSHGVCINVLPEEDAIEFICQRIGLEGIEITDGKRESVGRFAERLGCHPLAMELAGAYICETPGMTPDAYIVELNKNIKKLDETEGTDAFYRQTVSEIIQTTKEKIKGLYPAETANGELDILLLACSCLSPHNIDIRIFRHDKIPLRRDFVFNGHSFELFWHLEAEQFEEEVTSKFLPFVEVCANPENLYKYSRWLVNYGLVAKQEKTLCMHPLVQEVIRRQEKPNIQIVCGFGLLELLFIDFQNSLRKKQEPFALSLRVMDSHTASIMSNLRFSMKQYWEDRREETDNSVSIDTILERTLSVITYYQAAIEMRQMMQKIEITNAEKLKSCIRTDDDIKGFFHAAQSVLENKSLIYNEDYAYGYLSSLAGYHYCIREHANILFRIIVLLVQYREFETAHSIFHKLVVDINDAFYKRIHHYDRGEFFLKESERAKEISFDTWITIEEYSYILSGEIHYCLAIFSCYAETVEDTLLDATDRIYDLLAFLNSDEVTEGKSEGDANRLRECGKRIRPYAILRKSYIDHEPSLLPEEYKKYMKEKFHYSTG